jgi:uncharacterized protein
MTGEERVPLTRAVTWAALNDTAVLKDCIPGCEAIEQVSDNEYKVTLVAKVGPVSAKFLGKMTITDMDPPNEYTLVFEGQGGVAGFAKGQAHVQLEPDGEATRLAYSVKAMIGGKLAQVGARLIDGVAKNMATQFFKAFNERASAPAS